MSLAVRKRDSFGFPFSEGGSCEEVQEAGEREIGQRQNDHGPTFIRHYLFFPSITITFPSVSFAAAPFHMAILVTYMGGGYQGYRRGEDTSQSLSIYPSDTLFPGWLGYASDGHRGGGDDRRVMDPIGEDEMRS